MRTHVEFRSDQFPAYPGEEEKINEPSKPTIWKFPLRQISTVDEVARVADVLDKVLTPDPAIHSVRWWSENER